MRYASMAAPDHPRLSVVVVLVGDTITPRCTTANLAGVLAALADQRNPPPMEVIVPYHAGVEGVDAVRSRFPNVRYVYIPDLASRSARGHSREHHDELRARGVALARGEIVACLEDHVRPAPDWAAQLVAAHQTPYAAVGGAIENGVNHPLNWAAYFCDLGKYGLPLTAGESPYASTVNIGYKRAALEAIRPLWQTRFNETTVNAALRQRGAKLALSPGVVVTQERGALSLATVVQEFFIWGRSYAATRRAGLSPARRWAYALLAPWLPLLLLLRLGLTVWRKGRRRGAFVRALPFTLPLTVAWAWGETVGYWRGLRPVSQPNLSPPTKVGADRPSAECPPAWTPRRRTQPAPTGFLPLAVHAAPLIGRFRAGAQVMRRMERPLAEVTSEATPTAPAPSVSVVIAWVNPWALLEPGLAALLHGQRPPDEVIVVTRHGLAAQSQLQAAYPSVTLLAAPPNTPITALRSRGLRQARGAVVAVTEDHCIPSPTWVSTIQERLGGRVGVVGGPVENASTTRWCDWAAFLTEYAGAVRPAKDDGAQPSLPGNNVAYHRDLLSGLCETLDSGRWESFYHHELAQRHIPLLYDPTLVVFHRRPFDIPYFVGQRYHFSRAFAAMRCQTLSRGQRALYAVGSLALPPLLVWRGLTTLWRKGRLVGQFIACLPLIGLYVTVGAVGEMVGYLWGGGHSLERVE